MALPISAPAPAPITVPSVYDPPGAMTLPSTPRRCRPQSGRWCHHRGGNTAVGDSYKCVVDGVDGTGKATHNEWTGKFDGKDYPVTGDPASDTRSLKMTSPGHYALTNAKAGTTIVTGTVEFSADSKTRTLTMDTTDATGKKVTSVAVYDRQ